MGIIGGEPKFGMVHFPSLSYEEHAMCIFGGNEFEEDG